MLYEVITQGAVKEAVYYGEVAHYVFESNGLTMKISELNPRLARLSGGSVYAWADSEDIVVLND